MMPNLFRKTTNSEDENEQPNEKAENRDSEREDDLPPLIHAESIERNSTNLLNYMNPNLRQPGQYAASLNETDE